MASEDRLLTVAEVAARLQVDVRTIRRYITDGRMRAFKLGGDKTGWRIRASEVERFIREREEASTS